MTTFLLSAAPSCSGDSCSWQGPYDDKEKRRAHPSGSYADDTENPFLAFCCRGGRAKGMGSELLQAAWTRIEAHQSQFYLPRVTC